MHIFGPGKDTVGGFRSDALSQPRVLRSEAVKLFLLRTVVSMWFVFCELLETLRASVGTVGSGGRGDVGIPSSAISMVFSASPFANFSRQTRRSGEFPFLSMSLDQHVATSHGCLGVLGTGAFGSVSPSTSPGRLRRVGVLGVAEVGEAAEIVDVSRKQRFGSMFATTMESSGVSADVTMGARARPCLF